MVSSGRDAGSVMLFLVVIDQLGRVVKMRKVEFVGMLMLGMAPFIIRLVNFERICGLYLQVSCILFTPVRAEDL